MNNKFKTILVPVDFSVNTEVAVKKAMDLATEGTVIHLLNVQMDLFLGLSPRTYQYVVENAIQNNRDVIDEQLQQWKWAIEESSEGIKVCTWIAYHSSVPSVIEKKVKELHADLIIIGKNSHHSWFPFLNTVVPSNIAERTNVPVLTVKPGALHSKTKKIVVPITSEMADHKMEIINALCHTFRAKVFLVSFMKDGIPSDLHISSLPQVYQWQKMKSHCPVEYTVLHGANKARELLNYAEKINADVLLVQPQSETIIGWLNKHISDVLPPESKVQVLAVKPAN